MVDGEVTDSTVEELELRAQEMDGSALAIVWMSPVHGIRVTALDARKKLVVGRAADCDVVLEGQSVSRKHACFQRNASFWFVKDLGSRNGVRLNGAPASLGPVTEGTVLRLGSWVGIVRSFAPDGSLGFGMLGNGLFGGPELARAMRWVEVAAPTGMPVVLEGETGTGKELFARAVHDASGRDGPFLAVNCAVLQPATAGAELFGYRRGAFTGAVEAHRGLVASADGGTFFLDEVADLPLEVQAQLLRAIEQREVMALGAPRAAEIDVRFIAATQRPLSRWVAEGRFRADLRARLEGFRIELPPLRQRFGDVPLLFLHLLGAHSPRPPRPDAQVLEWLALQPWPLNVREVVLLVRKTLATYPEATELTLSQITAVLSTAPERRAAGDSEPAPGRRRVDKRAFRPETVEAFRAALERTSGNVALAAAELEISRQRAYRILKHCAKRPTV